MFFSTMLRPALFRYSQSDPEKAHQLVINQLAYASRHPALTRAIRATSGSRPDGKERKLFGLRFPNPVGLASGFDKNGVALPAFAALGFGFLEAGTVTQLGQPGWPRPRNFRFPQDEALINRMGFPNLGADAVAAIQAQQRMATPVPVGWNISKSLLTPMLDATDDYLYSLRALYPHGDFFVINVSSPNTPGLRELQDKKPLDELLCALVAEGEQLALAAGQPPKPLLLKIAPDLTEGQLDDIVELCLDRGIAGIIATNTTLGRAGLRTPSSAQGGLSGRPLRPLARQIVGQLARRLEGRLPIIGVGGIHSPEDALRMFEAGASLIQIYTGFIYHGPRLITRINGRLRDQWLAAGEPLT